MGGGRVDVGLVVEVVEGDSVLGALGHEQAQVRPPPSTNPHDQTKKN